MAQAFVGDGAHDDMFKAGCLGVGGDTGASLPYPLAYTAVGIVVEAVHALRTHALVYHITVPTLPNGGSTVVYRVQPTGILALEKQFVGYAGHAVIGQGGHQDGGAEETGLQAVAVLFEILSQPSRQIFVGLSLHQVVLQGKEGRGLHGVHDVYHK